MAQVIADDGEIRFIRLEVLQFAELLIGAAVSEVASQCIHSVCGIDDDPAVAQAFDHLRYEAVVDIIGVDTE